MANDQGRCDNCGSLDGDLAACRSVWSAEHTHPRAFNDLTPVPCDLDLCGKCVRLLRRNLPASAYSGGSGTCEEIPQ